MNKVKAQIEALLYENAPNFEIAKVLKQEIKTYFYTLEETFTTSDGKDFLLKHTKKIDSILQLIHKTALRSMFGDYAPMKNSVPLALVALGSYGREQLCVYSDIDLMIVYKEIPGYNTKEMIEKILYILWDTGLKLGHRVHTVDELFDVSKTDITIKTALIESRFIEGSKFIWTETQNMITQIRHDDIEGFIEARFLNQEKKHHQYPLTMEPNLKEGSGGFRDANLVYWVGKILYNTDNIKSLPYDIIDDKEYKSFRIALEFLFRVRSALHLAAKKKEDKLRLDLIPKVSKLLGYEQSKIGHMKFAKKVISSLKTIRLYSMIWSETLTRKYRKETHTKHFIYPTQTKDFSKLLLTLSKKASVPFIAHPTLLRQLISIPKAERLTEQSYINIKKIFYQPYSFSVLSTLSYAKLLRYTIPPMQKVVDLPQFDGYHQYTVDIHSIHCLYHIEHIQDPMIQSLFDALTSDEKAMLKVVTFLHDSGKGRRRDHHLVGASLFKIFAHKITMNKTLIRIGERLIHYHTLMSKIAQREDLYNEKVILHFASHFPNKKLLDMIYILTYADMSGVGNNIYSSFAAKLLRTLYKQSLDVLGQTKRLDEAAKRSTKEKRLQRHKSFGHFTKSQQKKILQIPSDLFFLRYSTQRIIDISQKAFETKKHTYHISNLSYLTIEIIQKETFHLSYLLSKLHTLDVVNIDICKLFNGLKYFKIDFGQAVQEEELDDIQEWIYHACNEHTKEPKYTPCISKHEIDIDCEHSQNYAIMHLKSKDQKGLLAFIVHTFDDLGIDIVTAKGHTLKNHVRDIFLIEKNGNFCHNTEIIIEKLTGGV